MSEPSQEEIADIQSAGQAQVTAIQTKGDEVLNSLPQDYTELSEDVGGLKSAIEDLEAGSLSALGATAEQVPVADGNGSWAWGAAGGLPTGGTTGQALVKNSNASGDVKWANISGGASTLNGLSDVNTSGAWRGFEALVYRDSVWNAGAPTRFTYIGDDGNGNPCMPEIADVYVTFSLGYRILAEDNLADEPTYYVVTNMEEHYGSSGELEHVCEVTRIKENGKIVKRVFFDRYDSNSFEYIYAEETPAGMISNTETVTQAEYNALVSAGTVDSQTLYCIKESGS